MNRCGVREDVDQPLHQLDVGGAEAAEAEVDELPVAVARARSGTSHAASVARTHVRDGARSARAAARAVVGLGRIDVEVEHGRLVHELAVQQRGAPRSRRTRRSPRAVVVARARTRRRTRPTQRDRRRGSRRRRRQLGIPQLERVARDDPRPRPARGRDRREADDVVLDDDVGPSSSKISRSRSLTYFEPSISACHVGSMNCRAARSSASGRPAPCRG